MRHRGGTKENEETEGPVDRYTNGVRKESGVGTFTNLIAVAIFSSSRKEQGKQEERRWGGEAIYYINTYARRCRGLEVLELGLLSWRQRS